MLLRHREFPSLRSAGQHNRAQEARTFGYLTETARSSVSLLPATLSLQGMKYNEKISFVRQFHERAKTASRPVRDGHVVDSLRRLLRAARLHWAPPLLHRTLGPRGVPAASPHLLQPPGPAPLSHPTAPIRKAVARRGRNQHLRHRVNLSAIKLRNAI